MTTYLPDSALHLSIVGVHVLSFSTPPASQSQTPLAKLPLLWKTPAGVIKRSLWAFQPQASRLLLTVPPTPPSRKATLILPNGHF